MCARVVFLLIIGCGLSLAAAEPVSARFTVDLRYQPSGISADSFAANEAVGFSSRFSVLTTILKQDADGDGLPDLWESFYGLDASVNDSSADADGDGRSNLAEYNAGTNPIVADDWTKSAGESATSVVDTGGRNTGGAPFDNFIEVWARSLAFQLDTAGRAPDADKDGMPDWWEIKYGLDAFVSSATRDTDGDGRTDVAEYNAGTNPIKADDWRRATSVSGESFVTDTRIVVVGGNPSFDTAFAVIRVSDGFICDTGGLYYDWDGDGIPNWWEARFADSKTGLRADEDADGDGLDNYSEFVVYSDPTDRKSRFMLSLASKPLAEASLAIRARTRTNGALAFELSWQSVKGRTYKVFSTKTPTAWSSEPVQTFEGTGDVISVLIDQTQTLELFKVTVELTK